MAGTDITKVSTKAGTVIQKQGHTANSAFGSEPGVKVKGGRSVRDLNIPNAK